MLTRTVAANMGAIAGDGMILARPAIGAEHVLGQTDRLHEIVNALERKRREVELLADVLDHRGVLRRIGIRILLQVLRRLALVAANVTVMRS